MPTPAALKTPVMATLAPVRFSVPPMPLVPNGLTLKLAVLMVKLPVEIMVRLPPSPESERLVPPFADILILLEPIVMAVLPEFKLIAPPLPEPEPFACSVSTAPPLIVRLVPAQLS